MLVNYAVTVVAAAVGRKVRVWRGCVFFWVTGSLCVQHGYLCR